MRPRVYRNSNYAFFEKRFECLDGRSADNINITSGKASGAKAQRKPGLTAPNSECARPAGAPSRTPDWRRGRASAVTARNNNRVKRSIQDWGGMLVRNDPFPVSLDQHWMFTRGWFVFVFDAVVRGRSGL